jgi:hypothetical protein
VKRGLNLRKANPYAIISLDYGLDANSNPNFRVNTGPVISAAGLMKFITNEDFEQPIPISTTNHTAPESAQPNK